MGVNCLIKLPADVRLDDVARVIAVAGGLHPKKQPLNSSPDSWFVAIEGLEVKPSSVPEMPTITLRGKCVDGESEHYTTFHYESDSHLGRLVYPRSNAFWIAVGRRLVEFFGGSVTYSDCEGGTDYRKRCPRSSNKPTNGEPWQKFQEAILAVKPVTTAELVAARKWAAYK